MGGGCFANVEMCSEQFKVSLSAPALSFLIYECSNRNADFEGLIFGLVTTRQVQDVSDEANSDRRFRLIREIHIQRFIYLGAKFTFYDRRLQLNTEVIQLLLQTLSRSIPNVSLLGWFRLKRNLEHLGFSRIERRVMTRLVDSSMTAVMEDGICTPLFLIIRETESPKHDYGETGYQLFKFRSDGGGRFQPIRLHVSNIGSTSPTEYQQSPLAFGFPAQDTLLNMFSDFPGTVYNYASKMVQNSLTKLRTVCDSLSSRAEELNKSWVPDAFKNETELLSVALSEGFCPSEESIAKLSQKQKPSKECESENSVKSARDKMVFNSAFVTAAGDGGV